MAAGIARQNDTQPLYRSSSLESGVRCCKRGISREIRSRSNCDLQPVSCEGVGFTFLDLDGSSLPTVNLGDGLYALKVVTGWRRILSSLSSCQCHTHRNNHKREMKIPEFRIFSAPLDYESERTSLGFCMFFCKYGLLL